MTTAPRRPTSWAVRLARGNGLGYVVLGLLTIAMAFPSAALDILLGGALTAAGIVERRAAGALERNEPGAGTTLSRSELALCAAIVAYAALRMTVLPSPSLSDPALFGDALGLSAAEAQDMATSLSRALYGSVAVVAVLYQGGMAAYFRRFGGTHVGT